MDRSQSKILLILSFVFLLPVVLFTVFEINSLNEDEQMIEEIYNNQLDAILFSVNQASNDIVDNWSKRIVENHYLPKDSQQIFYSNFVEENLSIDAITFFDLENLGELTIYASDTSFQQPLFEQHFSSILSDNSGKLTVLIDYWKSNYRKLEPLGNTFFDNSGSSNLLVFVMNDDQSSQFAAVSINPSYFIQKTLSPKIQSISQEKFIIAAYQGRDNSEIYSTEPTELNESSPKRAFWLLPDYYLQISLKGQTMESMVQERATINIALLVGLVVVLLIGLWLVYKNIKKALQLAQAKSDFVSNVSHEIRTPLALIHMFAETLEMDRIKTETKKKEYYHIIGQEANRLTGIVNKILNFSKMEANKYVYNFKKEDLNQIVTQIMKTYEYHLKNNGFNYEMIMGENDLLISADRQTMEEAIINLLDNAMKYSTDNKSIVITSGRDSENAFIAIKDHGIGISKEDQQQIFNKFYRVSKGEVHNTKGTGLGLSLVKQIVEAHHAKLELESKLGYGSIFKIVIPLIDKP